MTRGLPLHTAARIAWRETRSSLAKFLFVVLAVAAGVGSLAGVRGFSESFRAMLLRNAKTLMAADLTARMFHDPSPQELAALDKLSPQHVERTRIVETVSMVASAEVPTPLLVSIKAVDPTKYPFYGEVKLSPPQSLAQALQPDTVAVAGDLLVRLKVSVGDMIRLGGKEFRVAAVVDSEPDRMTGSLNVGLRMMLSHAALDRTGLIQPGSRAAQRFLFKLDAGAPSVAGVHAAIHAALPDALVSDSQEVQPTIQRGLEHATTFLSLVSLIALIVGSLGVGMAMHAHLQQKMDNVAIMKSVGASSGQIIGIYSLQTLLLGVVGGVLGVAVGALIQEIFPALINRYFQMRPPIEWNAAILVQGIAVGVLTTLLFTLPPLLSIRQVRPALIFRRHMEQARPTWGRRLKQSSASIAAGVLIVAGLAGIAAWLSASLRIGAYFAGGLLVSLLVLAVVAWILLRAIRLFLLRTPWRLPALLRHGLANVYRQGNQAQAVLVALGLGVMFTASVYLVQKSVVNQIQLSAPPSMPNVFLIDISPAQSGPLLALIQRQPGLLGAPQLAASVDARLVSVNGVPIEDIDIRGWRRRFSRVERMTWEDQKPDSLEIVQGAWWDSSIHQAAVSVAEETAKILGIQPGSQIEVESAGRTVTAEVRAIHRGEGFRMGSSEFIFNHQALAGLPAMYNGGVRMKPAGIPSFQREAYDQFPTVTVINVADVLEMVQEVVDQIALVIRFLSAFAILAGAIILAASVAGTRFRRIREVVILKTLGATRRHVVRIFSIEFLTLGAVAGLMGGLLANAFANLLLKRLMDESGFRFDVWTTLAAMALTAVLANAAGWLASFRILGQKPLEVLRDE